MKNQEKFVMLVGIFASTLVVSNILATKLWVIPYFNIIVPAGVVAYPITFLMTDVIGEVWGRSITLSVVKMGFICALISLLLGLFAVMLPPAKYFSSSAQEFFAAMFSSAGRITFASLFAYWVAQLCDVFIFHKLRTLTNAKHLWLRNNVSTVISQLLDTSVFIVLAFYGIMPTSILGGMIVGQWCVKIVIAIADTPFCYLLVAWCGGGNESGSADVGNQRNKRSNKISVR
jgi:hypothetical protein